MLFDNQWKMKIIQKLFVKNLLKQLLPEPMACRCGALVGDIELAGFEGRGHGAVNGVPGVAKGAIVIKEEIIKCGHYCWILRI